MPKPKAARAGGSCEATGNAKKVRMYGGGMAMKKKKPSYSYGGMAKKKKWLLG